MGEWNGDADLGDGHPQQQHREYESRQDTTSDSTSHQNLQLILQDLDADLKVPDIKNERSQ